MLEKEGKDYFDKKLIFSVIQNRLKKNMKLQLDATTIYAITDGKYDLERDLMLKDLKIKHPYNTYYIKGLPPNPISYVGKKTMESADLITCVSKHEREMLVSEVGIKDHNIKIIYNGNYFNLCIFCRLNYFCSPFFYPWLRKLPHINILI